MSIGQRIKAARKKANMTQAQLAELVGLSTITIRQYESDKREPRYQIIEKLSKALKCSISELVESKQEAQMIIDSFITERSIPGQRFISVSKIEDDDVIDAFAELKKPGSVVQQYTEFIATHPLLTQLLKDIGIEFELTNWHMITIRYEDQEITCSISSLISDLELLMGRYKLETRSIFEEYYGFKFHSDEED